MIGSRLAEVYRSLINVAMGREKADLLIENCNIVDVISGDIFEGSIAIKGDRIALVGEKVDAYEFFDAKGLYAVPGFIDAHAHPDFYLTLPEYSSLAVKHGTTTLFSECDAALNALGTEGFELFVKWARECPARIYINIPYIFPQDPAVEDANFEISYEELAEIAGDLLVGLGEVLSWSGVISLDEQILKKIDFALEKDLVVLGHTAGAKRNKLQAYSIIAGSCHEAITQEEALEKLRSGLHLMVREGSIRSDLGIIKGIKNVDKSWISIVSDGVDPRKLVGGYMDSIARKAVELGLDPIDVLRMITVNPAKYYGMERDLGIIAPPRYADIVLLKSLEKFEVERVFVGGKIPKEAKTKDEPYSVMNVEKIEREDLKIDADGNVKIRMMRLVTESVTKEVIREVEVKNGETDFCKAVLVDRFKGNRIVIGLIENLEMEGTVSSTFNFDEYNILTIGRDYDEIAKTTNKLIKMGGGIIYSGKTNVELRLPYGGVMSNDVGDVIQKLEKLNEVLKDDGFEFENPLNVLYFLTFVTLPELKISNKGLVKVKERKIVPLIVES
ncbi:Adenine deaminase [Ferroglobus placidus DSM 10642]|uniref:adenine deaminase n=1 Tax=Ferroglobus placidus (strain DSM 10642 / AEDII12DO) TaxID=589924 RepID=D3S148_FERPA|nr:adenine deaminase C-terminal domain-containing protein [Ferroglobus placidus]ADC64284.1 Adenine deaminase [Ferroglobus placidus DSM 10642]